MITSLPLSLSRKTMARAPLLSPSLEAEAQQRQNAVVFSDGAVGLTLPDGEALVVDVRAGVTPAEQVQYKLMRLLQDRSSPPRR